MFNLDSHNQRLEETIAGIGRLTRWYEKATHDKKVLEESLRAQIQSLARASLDQEEKVKYIATKLQDNHKSEVKARLERIEAEKLLIRGLENMNMYV